MSLDKIQGDIDKNEELMDTRGERRIYILCMEREKDGIIITTINKWFFASLLLAIFFLLPIEKWSVRKEDGAKCTHLSDPTPDFSFYIVSIREKER